MANVLIRDVPAEDLEQIRSAAADQDMSMQAYLLDALRAQAAYLRRQAALARTGNRLRTRSAVPEDERAAVLDAMNAAHDQRAELLGDRPTG